MASAPERSGSMKVVVTGGAGFIGVNLGAAFASDGHEVIAVDNLSRTGSTENATWLCHNFPTATVRKADVRTDHAVLAEVVADADAVYHLAAQVAVTTSVTNPREDFEINALGTFNVLEAVRRHARRNPVVIYSSTNKVYGGMEDIAIVERHGRYEYRDLPEGIPEDRLLDFHSPYGCSKGAADQYVRDYARIYGLRTVVFRQSCIYGPRQFGIEDQGWVAWFTIATMAGKPITVYGDGKQVRDVLYIGDLIQAFRRATEQIDVTSGQVYNIGGGAENTMSLLELIEFLKEHHGTDIRPGFADWRPGDQPVYVSDVRKAKSHFGWEPTYSVRDGVKRLAEWAKENYPLFQKVGLLQ
jgi:CDP-paratose 2-epimerase